MWLRPRPRISRWLRICCRRHPRLRRRLGRPLRLGCRCPLGLLGPLFSSTLSPVASDRSPALIVDGVHFATFSVLPFAFAFASCGFSAVLAVEVLGHVGAFRHRRSELASSFTCTCRRGVAFSLAVAAWRATCLPSALGRRTQSFRMSQTSAVVARHWRPVFAFPLSEGVELESRLPLLLLPRLLLLLLRLRLGRGLSEPGVCSSPGILRLSFGLPPIIRAVGGRLR